MTWVNWSIDAVLGNSDYNCQLGLINNRNKDEATYRGMFHHIFFEFIVIFTVVALSFITSLVILTGRGKPGRAAASEILQGMLCASSQFQVLLIATLLTRSRIPLICHRVHTEIELNMNKIKKKNKRGEKKVQVILHVFFVLRLCLKSKYRLGIKACSVDTHVRTFSDVRILKILTFDKIVMR